MKQDMNTSVVRTSICAEMLCRFVLGGFANVLYSV